MELGYQADDVQAQTKVGCVAALGPVSDQGVKISLLATRPETGSVVGDSQLPALAALPFGFAQT
jgi:hypothetical protein